MLTGAKAKYHELLAAALEPEVSRIVAECSGRALQVRSADQAAELSASLGLQLSWRSGHESLGPTAPFPAPFSSAVPELLRVTRRWVCCGDSCLLQLPAGVLFMPCAADTPFTIMPAVKGRKARIWRQNVTRDRSPPHMSPTAATL